MHMTMEGHHGHDDLEQRLHEALDCTCAEVAGDVLQIGVRTWAIHGSILVDGEVLLADYDSPQDATEVLLHLAASQVATRSLLDLGPTDPTG
jgi:hypothetical protein